MAVIDDQPAAGGGGGIDMVLAGNDILAQGIREARTIQARADRAAVKVARDASPSARLIAYHFGVKVADLTPSEWAMSISMGLVPPKAP